jgi:hypothetical protein
MRERVLWVIRNQDTDYIFPTLKQARASNVGRGLWGYEGIRIISRIVVYKFKKGSHA